MASTPAPTFTDAVRARSDASLVALLRARPDLASPSPSTLRSLAARASSRTSLERALAHADAGTLQVLEAVLALSDDGPVTAERVVAAIGADDAAPAVAPNAEPLNPDAPDADAPDVHTAVGQVLDAALEAALLWDAGEPGAPDLRPSPGLDEVLGPYPAGLGPARPPSSRPATPNVILPGPEGDEQGRTSQEPDLPPGSREILDALAWGPPVGVVPPAGTGPRRAVDALVGAGLLLRSDARHVVLPRDAGLALRGGRTHRSPELRPPRPDGRPVPPASADAEAVSAALQLVRWVDLLVAAWEDTPPPVLRAGGLGVRELRRTAQALGTDEATAALVVEVAAAAGLVADDGDAPASYVPTTRVDAWDELDDAERWATLAGPWAASRRTPWQVGSRDEKGSVRAPLSPDLQRPWVPRLRAEVLTVLADQPGTALRLDDVMAVLRWRSPRAVPPEPAVAGLLREAQLLGTTGAGALSGPGRAYLARTAAGSEIRWARAHHLSDSGLEEALRAVLPPEVDEILIQGDLTGIVPGRPSQALARLLERTADAESRGAALTVRFTPTSVTRALDHGTTADELLSELARRSPVPVPQPLEYLVRDTARRHESLRVGSASSYVRSADPTVLAGLVEDPRLASLGLVRLAPTVLAAAVPPAELHDALRERGLLSALEGPDGRVLGRLRAPARLDRSSTGRRGPSAAASPITEEGRAALVARLRAADGGTPAGAGAAGVSAVGDGAVGDGAVGDGAVGDGAVGDGAVGDGAVGDGESTAPEATTAVGPGQRAANPAVGHRDVPHAAARVAARAANRGTDEPGEALALLHDALRDGRRVWVEMVGHTGGLERRELKPLRLDGGRLRALDADREAELTIAVHRIASVTPAPDVTEHPTR
jgi:hypothetical protein